ncbi:hypothetical protein G7072_07450 [Nocardioides sp. HDW12B]|uniref:hypothetical protein n=1 Tax=Nocardioides sp. HDW12B TaxID=2714939 RepID=UPI00140BD54D|nr:hypothetical protein [Nocardioides sp. HDW12B]QIK66203.1 hypothetical protein G7072_07450 [Nocardioides sp. HDW12B]
MARAASPVPATSRERWARRTTVPAALASLLLGLLTVVALPAPPATAATSVWSAAVVNTAPTTISNVQDGSESAAQFTYRSVDGGFGEQTWDFSSVYDPGAEIPEEARVQVPWSWQGFHAYFNVTATLRAYTVIGGVKVYQDQPLVSAGPRSCCETPSAGFSYGGVATFSLLAGQEYGFEVSGSNGDSNNTLSGTFTLSTRPYLESLGGDNRQWTKATDLIAARPAGDQSGSAQDKLTESGESRWFRVPVIPGQTVSATLTGLPKDYDLALYGDIGKALTNLTESPDLTALAASATAGTAGNGSQVPEFPEGIVEGTMGPALKPGPSFAPRAYAPRAYAPRAYAPRAYAPRAYAPRAYAPRAYAPATFDPGITSNADFQQAFSTAQDQSLIAVSARSGRGGESVSARSGNTTGFYYLRVQGHGADDFSGTDAFTVSATRSGGAQCAGVSDSAASGWEGQAPTSHGSQTIVLTDSTDFQGTDPTTRQALLDALDDLARSTSVKGTVLDLAQSPRVQALKAQVDGKLGCPYAVNLVADAVDDLVDERRTPDTRYVVVAGGDDIVPFFRYPDLSGLGQESQFKDTMKSGTQAGESLAQDQLLSQDAYGSQTQVTIAGATLPVPDLAVGRLVKSPEDIIATVEHYLEPDTRPIRPTGSLVTGYDFLADAAHAVSNEFGRAMDDGDAATTERKDELITEPGVPYPQSWDDDELRTALLGSRHDLVYLAGHFNANETLTANFTDTFSARELEPAPDKPLYLEDTLVLSAGCHSGYTVVPGEQNEANADTYDWAQAMAQQRALLIGGTGYQYGDTEFLEYSERIYLNIARELRRGTGPVAVGEALMAAKRDYLASLSSVTGIDQKAVMQATMYGLPMAAVDAPRRTGDDPSSVRPTLQRAPAGTPGAGLGLDTADVDYATPTDEGSRRTDLSAYGAGLPGELTWLNGRDGVSVFPGEPVLPKQVEDVTAPNTVLRGVGFVSGTYRDDTRKVPLTGAPAVESSTPHTGFESLVSFPQRLATPNYFDTLVRSSGAGRTSLVLTPAQYRTEAASADDTVPTNSRRAYSRMGFRLFYANGAETFAGNAPFQAAAPSISDVSGTTVGRSVTVSARVTGDPSAGVQEAWLTWTGENPGDTGHGRWQSRPLEQDDLDSTLWSATFPLPAGQSAAGFRFLVQAANGVGAVSLDAAEGNGHGLTEAGVDGATVDLSGISDVSEFDDIAARVTGSSGTVLGGRGVSFTLTRGPLTLTSVGTTDDDGVARMPTPLVDGTTDVLEGLPSGAVHLKVAVLPPTGSTLLPAAPVETDLVIGGATVTLTPTATGSAMTRAGSSYSGGTTATVTDARGPVPGAVVTFGFPESGPRAGFPVPGSPASVRSTWTGTTSSYGAVTAPAPRAGTLVGGFDLTVGTPGATAATRRHTAQYAFTAFGSPVSRDKVSTNASGTVPLKVSALDAAGRKVPDAEAAALVSARRVRLSWTRTTGRVGAASGSTDTLARYLADKDFFQADLKPSSLGWGKGTYQVRVVVLDRVPAASGMPTLHLGASGTVTIAVS